MCLFTINLDGIQGGSVILLSFSISGKVCKIKSHVKVAVERKPK